MNRLRTSTKLSVYYAMLIILLIGSAAVIYYNYSKNSIEELGVGNLSQNCDSVMVQIDNRLTNMEQVSVDVLSNNQFTAAWKRAITGEGNSETELKDVMTRAFVNKGDIRRVSVFGEGGVFYSTGVCTATPEDVHERFLDIQRNYTMNHMNSRTFLSPHLDDWHRESDGYVISEIKPIKDENSRIIGYLEIQQNVLYIDKICNILWNRHPLYIMVFVEKDELFYSNLPDDFQDGEAYLESIIELTKVYSKTRETADQIVCTTTSNYYDCKVVVALDKAVLFESLAGLLRGLVIGAAALILLTIVYILFVTHRIMEPINMLVNKMASVDLNNLHRQEYNETNNLESRVLITAFEQMRIRLNTAMEERKRLEDVQTKTLFSILQSETSPHFLYNTLGSIANMCENGENEEAADACYSLTEILRYSSNYATSEVTVREEIENLRAYLAVMKSRYRSRLVYELFQDEDTNLFMLPKLTYQPIVENAIKYSLAEREQVVVRIYTVRMGDQLIIEIKDNGCGISPEAVEKVSCQIREFNQGNMAAEITEKIQFGGMGLSGTLIRLSIFFGEAFSYHLLPDNDERGSSIVLCIRIDQNQ